MKKLIYLFIYLLIVACSGDSVSEEFDNTNGNVQEKLISSIALISNQDSQENGVISLSYNSDGSLNTINNGTETQIFIYNDNNELTNVSGGGDNLNVLELYESPYEVFETGEVVVYDDNGNPQDIEFYEEEEVYDNDTGNYYYVTKIYTAEITYDNTHNPYFYTLEAAGIIEVLDGVQLDIGVNAQLPEIVQARMFFPLNNPSQINYKNEEGQILFTTNANYVYDDENYPTSATITNVKNDEVTTYSAIFQYVD
tara:strand:- start:264 stop:1025 length:762 start_codon:yes stop_codon:yes gene_type:complete